MTSEAAGARLWHVGLTVGDLDTSIAFYETVLGARVEHQQEERTDDFDRLSDNSGTQVRVAWLAVDGGTFVLQLVQYLAGGDGRLAPRHARVGTAHLSFYVANADAEYTRLAALGTVDLPGSVNAMGTHGRSFYLHDPDGVPVELWQPIEPRDRFNRPV